MGRHGATLPPRPNTDKPVVAGGIIPIYEGPVMDYRSTMNEYMIELREARNALMEARNSNNSTTLSLQWSSVASVHAELAQSLATLLLSFGPQ